MKIMINKITSEFRHTLSIKLVTYLKNINTLN